MKVLLNIDEGQLNALKRIKASTKWRSLPTAFGALKKISDDILKSAEHDEPFMDQKYRDAVPTVDGDLECDGEAIVSKGGDDGAYVQCWKWVSDEDAGIETKETEGR